MRISISEHHDPHYDSWRTYYEWDGTKWTHHDEGTENESGAMGAFNKSRYHHVKDQLTRDDGLAILKHFKLKEEQIPIEDVFRTGPERLTQIASE